MLPFHLWIESLAGTIPDASEILPQEIIKENPFDTYIREVYNYGDEDDFFEID